MTTVPSPARDARPLVSVVMATYNRSNILRYAIESVRWQTVSDWELWVVGDACTDDTAAVIASFDDRRIRFLNVGSHVGEQSGPNNEGARRSRGRYLAYLNHDDLWLPDHLEIAVDALENPKADLVWPMAAEYSKKGKFHAYRWDVGKKFEYRPFLGVPASFWVFRSKLVGRVGPWRGFRECYGGPSQDWLYRAYSAGYRMRFIPTLTMVTVSGGRRVRAYAERQEADNRLVFERIRDHADFRERLMPELLFRACVMPRERAGSSRSVATDLTKLLRRFWYCLTWRRRTLILHKEFSATGNRVLTALGLNPIAIGFFVKYGQKGKKIHNLRIRRGLPPIPE